MRTQITAAVGALIGLSCLVVAVGYRRLELDARERASDQTSVVLRQTQQALELWAEGRFRAIEQVAGLDVVVRAAEGLATVPRDQLATHPLQEELRGRMRVILRARGDHGIFLITPEGYSIASMRDANVGTPNFLGSERGGHIARSFAGETVFIPAVYSDVPLGADQRQRAASMFLASPVRNARGDIIAVFTMRLDPQLEFGRILSLGRFGETGETYAVDDQGRFASASRFERTLRLDGLLDSTESSVVSIEAKGPDGEWTFPAAAVLAGEAGSSTSAFTDYRGERAFGSWRWDDQLGVGIITKIDEREALRNVWRTLLTFMGLAGVSIVLSLLVAAVLVRQARDRALIGELTTARQAAEEASRSKDSLLKNTTHELRTPLNGVIGMAELLEADAGEDEDLRDGLRTIRTSARALLSVINDILEASRLQGAGPVIQVRPFDPSDLVMRVVRGSASAAVSRGLDLVLDIAADVPRQLVGDEVRVGQILTNLVGNAVKFTERGHVLVRVRWREGSLSIQVEDTGVGIEAEERERIFEEFVRTQGAARFRGTGLGLAITRDLAAAMGGTVSVQSELGKGSRFRLELPMPAVGGPQALPDLSGRELLVVGVPLPLRDVLCGELRRAGAVLRCVDEMPPLSLADRLNSVVYVDSVDKVGLAAELRSHGRVVALVPLGSAELRQGCARAGLERLVTLPSAPRRVLELAALPDAHVGTEETVPEAQRGVRVLLVEDNPVNQRVALGMLKRDHHRVVVVGDGESAVIEASVARFDLVLMDFQLPGISGLEATREIRALPGCDSLPVVGLTALNQVDAMRGALDAGMVEVVGKPISLDVLRQVVRDHARRATPAVDLAGLRDEWSDMGLLDQLPELVAAFMVELDTLDADKLSDLSVADLGALAHRCRSGAGAMRAFELAELLGRLEVAVNEGDARAILELKTEVPLAATVAREALSPLAAVR